MLGKIFPVTTERVSQKEIWKVDLFVRISDVHVQLVRIARFDELLRPLRRDVFKKKVCDEVADTVSSRKIYGVTTFSKGEAENVAPK